VTLVEVVREALPWFIGGAALSFLLGRWNRRKRQP